MLREAATSLFGPSRASVRRAVAAYLNDMKEYISDAAVPREQVVEGYKDGCKRYGWPRISTARLFAELDALGCPAFEGIRIPAHGGAPAPTPALPPQAPIIVPPQPKHEPRPVMRTLRDDALVDLLSRLERGETIPSQDALCAAWRRSRSTVSEWLTAWERRGLIPPRQRDGRCNVIHMRQRRAAAA